MIILSGCTIQPKVSKPKIDPNLPKVKEVRYIPDITKIALEWTPIYSENIKGYYIYRGQKGTKLTRIAKIDTRFSSHYIDKKLNPDTKYYYQITAFTKRAESYPSPKLEAKTLPVPESVSFLKAVDHLPRIIKLIWRPHPYLRVDGYIVERADEKSADWKKIAYVKDRLSAEYIDSGLKDNMTYLYRLKAKTCDGIVSKPSKVVKGNTKPRPSIVKGLEATKNLPKKIIVRWLPNPEPDIEYYKVYRSMFEIGPYIAIAKTKKTQYTDFINKDGVKRYYKVTAVDKDRLESFKQDVPAVGSTLPKPAAPVILEHHFDGRAVTIKWQSPDNRAVEYMVRKKEILGFLKENEYIYKHIKNTSFYDDKLKKGAKYIYRVYAVDKYGIVSKPSEEIVVKVK